MIWGFVISTVVNNYLHTLFFLCNTNDRVSKNEFLYEMTLRTAYGVNASSFIVRSESEVVLVVKDNNTSSHL